MHNLLSFLAAKKNYTTRFIYNILIRLFFSKCLIDVGLLKIFDFLFIISTTAAGSNLFLSFLAPFFLFRPVGAWAGAEYFTGIL